MCLDGSELQLERRHLQEQKRGIVEFSRKYSRRRIAHFLLRSIDSNTFPVNFTDSNTVTFNFPKHTPKRKPYPYAKNSRSSIVAHACDVHGADYVYAFPPQKEKELEEKRST